MNYTKVLKKNPLPSGFFSVCGEQGAGKTSLVTALFRTDYKYHRKWRYEQGKALARTFYDESGVELNVDRCLYFSNTKIVLDRRRNICTHEIDIERLGLPNPDYEVQYLPRGSVVFIQEADVLAFCRNWQSLSDYLRNLIKYVRHNCLTIIFDMQWGGDLDAALRRLTVGQFYVFESGLKRFLLFWQRQKWKYIYVHVQRLNFVNELAKAGVKIKMPIAENMRFNVWGNVFDCYNSFSGIPYFLDGIDKVGYEYREHTDGDLSIKGIQRYCKAHPLARTKDNTELNSAAEILKQLNPYGLKQAEEFLKKLIASKRNRKR